MNLASGSITLTSQRLVLRAPEKADWPAYARFMETENARFFAGYRDVGKAWRSFGTIIWHWIDRGFGPWAVTLQGSSDCIGIVGPKCPVAWPEGEITWIIFGGSEGKGLAYEAAQVARADAYRRLDWKTAVSYIESENTRSVALAQRLGARLDTDAKTPGGPVQAYRHPKLEQPHTGQGGAA